MLHVVKVTSRFDPADTWITWTDGLTADPELARVFSSRDEAARIASLYNNSTFTYTITPVVVIDGDWTEV